METIEKKSFEQVLPILLVDDEDPYRMALARRLERRKMNVIQAGDGTSCLDILSHTEVDVVVLDMKMPGLSGMETFESIKKYHPGVQVIFLTGNAAVAEGVEGVKAGAFDYLSKPVEIDHLAGKIFQACEMRRLETARERDRALRRRLERKMIHTERLASLGTMSTGIAHEINNPLAVIKESAGLIRQVLEMPGKTPDKALLFKGLEKIEKSIDRAGRITHQLLGYVRKQGSELSKVDIGILLDDSLGLVRQGMKGKELDVIQKLGPGARFMYTDPFQVRQVLVNLLDNAMDALPPKGMIHLSTFRKGKMVCLKILDNGPGINKDDLEKIFDPFFTTKPVDQGTGLGLFVVHRIMENLGGSIVVDSTQGQGSTFTVCLPEWEQD
ncbi:MAG: response regulator [Desulfobacter sp.]|nr:response regulator [Desulfobacter sp.]WDP87430.1 MAG: response regulator [Desulfobacter sp.]